MERRRFLTRSGLALTATALAATPGAARGDGDPPNDRIDPVVVGPFLDKTVPAGTWLTHRVGWIDVHDPPKRTYIEQYLESLDFVGYTIDGEPVENPDAYWDEPVLKTSGTWEGYYTVFWNYTTPPVEPGVHEVAWTFEFTEPVDDGRNVHSGGPYTVAGEFDVVAGGEREN